MIRPSVSGRRLSLPTLVALLATAFYGWAATAQTNSSVFSKLRQLPDLGACPSANPADPDLNKSLTKAVTEARVQAKAMLDSVARMKDAGLASQENLQQLADSATKINQALANKDVCEAARAFAQLNSGTELQPRQAALRSDAITTTKLNTQISDPDPPDPQAPRCYGEPAV